jgi:hypothetical protein
VINRETETEREERASDSLDVENHRARARVINPRARAMVLHSA